MTNRSEEINELAKALSAAQSQIQPPHKTETAKIKGRTKDGRPYEYDYQYADLAGVWEAIRKPFGDNRLSVVQLPETNGSEVTVETLLLHESGQWIRSFLPCHIPEPNVQSIGKAITYLRRYSLMAVAGVAPEDDDGQGAMPTNQQEAESLRQKAGMQRGSDIQPLDEDYVKDVRSTAMALQTVEQVDTYGSGIKDSHEAGRISDATWAAARKILVSRHGVVKEAEEETAKQNEEPAHADSE